MAQEMAQAMNGMHRKRRKVNGCGLATPGTKDHLQVAGQCGRSTMDPWQRRTSTAALLILGPNRAQAMIIKSFLMLPVAVSGLNKSYSLHGRGIHRQ